MHEARCIHTHLGQGRIALSRDKLRPVPPACELQGRGMHGSDSDNEALMHACMHVECHLQDGAVATSAGGNGRVTWSAVIVA